MGALTTRALLFGIYIRAPNLGNSQIAQSRSKVDTLGPKGGILHILGVLGLLRAAPDISFTTYLFMSPGSSLQGCSACPVRPDIDIGFVEATGPMLDRLLDPDP